MTLSLRLDDELAEQVHELARREGLSKSELVRRCLAEYVAQSGNRPTAWELGRELFGRVGSGGGGLSRNRKRIVRDKLRGQADRG